MTEKIHPIDIILHKREGTPLTNAEIHSFIQAVLNRSMTDAQIASLLMAIFQRGLNQQELASLTTAMRYSGETLDTSFLNTSTPVFCVDKHSTGGVGDKTSLLIAPILAAAGLAGPTPTGVPSICVPMISGRSLGHTGGTLDKLETIPGFNTQLTLPQILFNLKQYGAALVGQTPSLVPADRILYALRDHTGTVESPYLIAASIMSKKLAEDLDALILDVKTGSGAFMPTYEQSRLLAELMVETGEASGTNTIALLTNHDQPLGRFAGNWVEVWECIDIMKQDRHPMSRDLIELTNILAGWMLYLAGHARTPQTGTALSNEILTSGSAFEAFLEIVQAQGGDISLFEGEANPADHHKPTATRTLTSETSGYFASIDTRQAGWAVQRLGAGRAKPGDPVSAHAGIEMHVKLGDRITQGQPLITLFSEDESLLAVPYEMLHSTIQITQTPPKLQPIVREVVSSPRIS